MLDFYKINPFNVYKITSTFTIVREIDKEIEQALGKESVHEDMIQLMQFTNVRSGAKNT